LFQHLLIGTWASKTGNKTIGLMKTAHSDQEDLQLIKELLEAGNLKSVIDRRYPLAETADAIRYLEEGHARGKVIIAIA
jgi:NADPH:quinone reductase-like Zn-dependent oxidoreductase